MATLTLQDYVQKVQSLIHDVSFSSWSQTEIIERINDARKDVSIDMNCVRSLLPVTLQPQQEIYPYNEDGIVAGARIIWSSTTFEGSKIPVRFEPAPPGGITAEGFGIIESGILTAIMLTRWGRGYTHAPRIHVLPASVWWVNNRRHEVCWNAIRFVEDACAEPPCWTNRKRECVQFINSRFRPGDRPGQWLNRWRSPVSWFNSFALPPARWTNFRNRHVRWRGRSGAVWFHQSMPVDWRNIRGQAVTWRRVTFTGRAATTAQIVFPLPPGPVREPGEEVQFLRPRIIAADGGRVTFFNRHGALVRAIMFDDLINVISVSVIWNTRRYTLSFRGFGVFQAWARMLQAQGWTAQPAIWTIHQQDRFVYVDPPPDQFYRSEWDVVRVAAPLINLTDIDTDIPDPWAQAVQFKAAEYLLMKHQNFGQVAFYAQKYDAFVPRIIAGAGGVRVVNPYNRAAIQKMRRT